MMREPIWRSRTSTGRIRTTTSSRSSSRSRRRSTTRSTASRATALSGRWSVTSAIRRTRCRKTRCRKIPYRRILCRRTRRCRTNSSEHDFTLESSDTVTAPTRQLAALTRPRLRSDNRRRTHRRVHDGRAPSAERDDHHRARLPDYAESAAIFDPHGDTPESPRRRASRWPTTGARARPRAARSRRTGPISRCPILRQTPRPTSRRRRCARDRP